METAPGRNRQWLFAPYVTEGSESELPLELSSFAVEQGCPRDAYESSSVISLPAGTRIWIAAGVTDVRRGFHGLSAQVQTVLEQQPLSGHVFVFRGRRGDIVKVLWFDGDGLCLLAERLERGRFVWPQATSGTVSLSRALLSMLLGPILRCCIRGFS
jgi:transposase